ncbi:MAG: hypothetical protein A2X46_01485 [Lentisphaerae bacterium GWF2_57_35]|nr:MAG: hypothetical protein A2X46_01485 [Lentisphaerae bacterium GWF2_57_35]
MYDGTGLKPFGADVGIRDGRIVEIGDLSQAEADETVQAQGLCVCPGFIDVHSHSDAYLLIEPSAPSKIFQGVTTEVVGNCGASAAPRLGAFQIPSDWQDKNYPGVWSSVADYRRLLEQARPAVNVVLLIGHRNLRVGVMGYEGRPSQPDEIRRMCALLEQALEEGGAGLSTGLIYAPGMFAQPEEIHALARVAAARNKIYTSHMRSEGARLLEAIDETLRVGRQTGIRVEISHLKTSGRKNWHLVDAALDRIRSARAEGLNVAADRYPYTAACTDLDVILPDWAAEGGRETILARLGSATTRKKIREEILAGRDDAYWTGVLIGSTWAPENASFQGMKLVDMASHLKLEPVDAAFHLFETDQLHTGAIFFGMSEENMWKILAEPYVMIGSDASIRSPEGPLSKDHPHPRAYGSFPFFLRAAFDGKTVEPAEAIRKMTSLPAAHFQLTDRGVLAKGKYADVVAFDPQRLSTPASYAKPHQLASGIQAVVVNGAMTIRDGRLTGERTGKLLSNRG